MEENAMSVGEMGMKEDTVRHSVDPTGKQKGQNHVLGAMAKATDKRNA